MKEMKVSLNALKAVSAKVVSSLNNTISTTKDFIKERNLNRRVIVSLLMISLLMPAFLFGEWIKSVSAFQSSLISSVPQASAPNSAPSVPFIYNSSDTISANFASTVLMVNTTLANGFVSAVNFFKTPAIPEGLEMAQPVSPASAFLFSIGDSVRSFFGFFSTSNSSNAMLTPPPPPAGSVKFDFDGDGEADLARFRSSTNQWEIKSSLYGTTTPTTLAGQIVPGDYDGDSITDIASFDSGTWTINKSSGGQQTVSWGTSGDIPVVGDYDGDGKSDYALYRPSTNVWWILQSSNGSYTATSFGAASDITVPGNYDGDTKTDIAVYRPSTGTWHILGSTNGYFTYQWGLATDIPVPGDYDGDGITDFAVYRGSSGTWYAAKSSASGQYFAQVWGNYGDQPVPADYDGDGKTDFAIWRPTNGVWHKIKSSDSTFDYQTFGINGDTAVQSAYLKQIGGTVFNYDLAKVRLSPKNETGGTNLYSRNFSWGSGLVNLSGRAGLDAGFGISYNSLVWTKVSSTNSIFFDTDTSNVSPGFRFGFPVIEPIYKDKDTENFSYLMVTPSGGRVEFKQTGASDIYKTVDSSYLQLKTVGATNPNDPVENITITVTGTDGTKMTYLWKAGAFRCSEIKDRNGNYITINHDDQGLLRTVTDTLGRVITVNYDSELYPTSITQDWKTNNGQGSIVQHTWATFSYTNITINTSFASGTNVFGPPNGTSVKVLDKITYPNGSSTQFEYNGYGQVWKVKNIAADSGSHILNYVSTNLQSPSSNQTDCPRFTETRNWVENFNNNQETVVTNSLTSNQSYSLPDGHNGTAAKIEVTMTNHPNGAISKTFVGESGWMEGLPVATEDWANGTSGSERKRWTWTAWTQDDTNLTYIQNPRVIESKVGDTTNIKRSTTEYRLLPNTTIAEYGLVSKVEVYDTDQTTVLKKAETDYNLDTAYVSRRIIGLPSETRTYGMESSVLQLAAKTTYTYDGEDFSQETNQNISNVIQHDNTNYSSSFITGRGNLTSTTRHDVLNQSASVTSKIRYDIAGSVVAQLDPLNRKVRIEYTDMFNDTTTSRNTFAYPTKLIDPADNYSEVKYRFDTGTNVWAKSPAPAENTNGKETVRLYDALGRLEKETLVNTGAYTRYEYPTNAIQSKVYTTIIDAAGNGADTSDEVYSESWTDGAGRVLRSRTEHPGSTGGWTGSLVEYDILGRAFRSTVPTEISVSGNTWTPAGDDNRGLDSNNNPVWLWTSAEYDWKNRVTREINTDQTDRLYSYEGCGCAGGQVTTVQSESVPREDQPTVNGRRTQKVYQDILGRNYKTEILNWNGTVYTTTVQTFNRRDQISNTRQYQGTTSSSVYQDVTMTYDGHGRMKTRHYPIEDAATDTTWIYNTDDSIQQIIDPRGVITNFVYETERGLLTQMNYQVPSNSSIPDSATVNYEYDDLGNRTEIETVGISDKTYSYDELSRLTSETVSFDALENNLNTNNPFTISYTYNLSGGLKSVTDPFGSTIDYANDRTGRLTAVGGTAYGENTTGDYAENIKYRAFGQIKQLNFVLPTETPLIKMEYDDRLRVDHSEITTSSQTGGYLLKADYTYAADGRAMSKNDLQDDKWDQTMKYDFAGRTVFNQFGTGVGSNNQTKRVYEQGIAYDAFSLMTTRAGVHWGEPIYFSATYIKGRIQNSDIDYDASGNIVGTDYHDADPDSYNYTTFDAAGRRTIYFESQKGRRGNLLNVITEHKFENIYDGEGRPVIEKEGYRNYQINEPPSMPLEGAAKHYQVWSSVLGSSLTMLDKDGNKEETKVFAGGAVIAKQTRFTDAQQNETDAVQWTTADPMGTRAMFGYSSTYGVGSNIEEYEPLGQQISLTDPAGEEEFPITAPLPIGSASEPEWQCNQNLSGFWGGFSGMPFHCQKKALMEAGSRLPWEDEVSVRYIITYADSKLPKFDPAFYSPPDSHLTYALKSTTKKDGADTKKKCPVINGVAQCTQIVDVEIKIPGDPYAPELPDDFRGADVGGQILEVPIKGLPTHAQLRAGLISAQSRNNGKCGEFLDKLRSQLGIEKTFVQLFDDLVKKYDDSNGIEGGVAYVKELTTPGFTMFGKESKATEDDGAYPYNNGKERKNALALKIKPEFGGAVQLDAYIDTLIHELIHYAGIEDHKVFATKGYESLDASGRKAHPRKKDRTDSQYFTDLLRDYCKKQEIK